MTRLCLRCGKLLVRHAGERPNRFRRRRYCGRQCAGHAMTQRNVWGNRRGKPTIWNPLDRDDGDLPTWVGHE